MARALPRIAPIQLIGLTSDCIEIRRHQLQLCCLDSMPLHAKKAHHVTMIGQIAKCLGMDLRAYDRFRPGLAPHMSQSAAWKWDPLALLETRKSGEQNK